METNCVHKIRMHSERFSLTSRRALNRIFALEPTFYNRKFLYYSCGLPLATMTYEPAANRCSPPCESFRERLSCACDALIAHSYLAPRAAGWLAGLFGWSSVLMMGYAAFVYLYFPYVQVGWLSTIFYLSFAFTGLFVILSLLARYLSALILTGRQEKPYNYSQLDHRHHS